MGRMHRIPFLVVGGGIGGLATALALSRKGYPAHVIERAPEFGEIGAGIQLGPNASRALDTLGVLDQMSKHAVYPQGFVFMDALSGEHLTTLDFGGHFRRAYTYPYMVVHRGDLFMVLLAACRQSGLITLETNRHVVAVDDLGDGARVMCADGSRYACGALIGADGLRSTVRKLMIDDSEPVCTGFVGYRGLIPIEEMTEHVGTDNGVFWAGPNIHLVQYPVRRGELYNQVAVFKSDRYSTDSDDWGTWDELEASFARTCRLVKSALTTLKRDRRWPLYDRLPTDHWTRHHITLLGDAAHPMQPFLAQGACQTLEDAVCLADMLARYEDDIGKAFIAYEETRIPRTARVQRMSRLFGEICHLDGVGAMLRNVLFAQRAHDDYTYAHWLYEDPHQGEGGKRWELTSATHRR
jgi:salicylate hydroxylase